MRHSNTSTNRQWGSWWAERFCLLSRRLHSPLPFLSSLKMRAQPGGFEALTLDYHMVLCSQPIFCCHRSTDTEWEFFCSSHFCPSHFDYQASVNIRSQNTRSIGPLFRSLKQSHGTHRNMHVVASHLRRRQGLCKLVSCHPLITHTYISLIKAAFLSLY